MREQHQQQQQQQQQYHHHQYSETVQYFILKEKMVFSKFLQKTSLQLSEIVTTLYSLAWVGYDTEC
jgi:hypothetical protein